MTTLDHNDVRWRVSNTWDKNGTKWGMLVGYIDSRTAMEALDALDPNWSSKMEPIALNGDSGIRCTLIVNGVAREDVGVASNTEPLKGAFSDALKRAAVHFGIGRELYELPKIAVECEVGNNGKVKAPKALPVYRNGRWDIDRKVGWVKYDRDPDEQPERAPASRTQRPGGATAGQPAPAQYRRAELAELAHAKGLDNDAIQRYAAICGVKDGERATDAQMDAIIEAIKGHGTDAVIEQPESLPAEVESVASEAPPPASDAPPPKPGTPEYGDLKPHERAAARAYWSNPPEQETLAEQLQVPA